MDTTVPIGPILVVIAISAVLVIVAVLNAKMARQRQGALAAWAQAHNWSFDLGVDFGHNAEFPYFEAFNRGSDRTAYNTIRGVATIAGRPFPIKCGDYRYTVSTGKNSTTYRLSYLILTLPFPNVPGLDIRRENLLDKFAGALGFQDINFESEQFSRAFFVKCPDRKFAYDVITPKMMEFLLASNPPPIHIVRGQICITDPQPNTWAPFDFDRRLAWAEHFFTLWPNFIS